MSVDESMYRRWRLDRGHCRGTVTKLIKGYSKPDSVPKAQALMYRCDDFKAKLEDWDEKILTYMISQNIDDEAYEMEYRDCERYQIELIDWYHLIDFHIKEMQPSAPVANVHPPGSPYHSKVSYQKLELPTFDGKPDQYNRFILQFEKIVEQMNVDGFAKFSLLEQQLRGDAKLLINSVPVSNMNFEYAKGLLDKAYMSKEVQQFATLDRLCKLKMVNSEPFKWISEVNVISEQFKNLHIDSSIVLQYFFWQSLSEPYRQQLVAITNNSKPTLSDILDHIYEANNRLRDVRGTCSSSRSFSDGVSVPESVAMAVNVDKSVMKSRRPDQKVLCTLCDDFNHRTKDCPKYPSPQDKVARLRVLTRCTRCTGKHLSDRCGARLYQCVSCKDYHLNYLCVKDCPGAGIVEKVSVKAGNSKPLGGGGGRGSKDSNGTKNRACPANRASHGQKQSNHFASISNVVSLSTMMRKDVLLPTLTASVIGRSGVLREVRALLDYGSQTSFITENLVGALDCETIDPVVNLYVKGFNEGKQFNSKLVKFNINIGDKNLEIYALCIPSFPMSLKLEGLEKVVEAFELKGWHLADRHLRGSEIADIGIILGSDNSHILPVDSMLFGAGSQDTPSCVLKSGLGILLQGSVQQILQNEKDLPHKGATNIQAYPVQAELEEREELLEMKIKTATDIELNDLLTKCINVSDEPVEECSELDKSLFNYIIENIDRDESGRIIVPALWDKEFEHRLANNFNLSKRILHSTLKKLRHRPAVLEQYDEVIREQINDEIVEVIPNLEDFLLENPGSAFLPHSAVIRESASTTKCRVVFLSNLCERRNGGMSHNEISFPGMNLNQSLFTSLLLLRFDSYLLSFDLCKAFLQIKLRPEDSRKLLFLWFSDVKGGDYNVIALRFLRLGFGLRFSPSVLVSVLYYILMVDVNKDDADLCAVAKRFYSLLYMDNISYTSSNIDNIMLAFQKSYEIFNAYGFDLQKFFSNVPAIQEIADERSKEKTPQEVDLFGMAWDRANDQIRCRRFNLNSEANTKRKVLKSLNAQFDPIGLYLPLLNRAKFFLHSLQLENLGWDTNIGPERCREWERICNQLNSHDDFKVDRNVGDRSGTFCLVGFSDASKESIGVVFYLWNKDSNKVTFIHAKSKVLGRALRAKTIPVLELVALAWGAEVAVHLRSSLVNAVEPVEIADIYLFTDSSISLSWLRARASKTGKIERKSVVVNNKVNKIISLGEATPMHFRFVDGYQNPADLTTRSVSSYLLKKSNFLEGPGLEALLNSHDEVRIPHLNNTVNVCVAQVKFEESIVNLDKYSSFRKATRILNYVYGFIRRLQKRIHSEESVVSNTFQLSSEYILRKVQEKEFPNVFRFFKGEGVKCDPIITQLNIFLDGRGLLRVKSKFAMKDSSPILLPRSSSIARSIIQDLHEEMKHAQVYKLLGVLRQKFYIPKAYSTVKHAIKDCVLCKKLHGRTLKSNVGVYRDFRVDPSRRAFSSVMCDSIGPFRVRDEIIGERKVYVLILTCLYTRAVSLYVCKGLDTESFLYALQLNVLEYGMIEHFISDNQPSFISGTTVVDKVIEETEVQNYFKIKGVRQFKHQTYPAGASFLGGAVESLVKQVKHVLFAGISRQLLSLREFEFLVAETKALVNKRPIAFKSLLSENKVNPELPFAITPELLLKGYEVPSINLLPGFDAEYRGDYDWQYDSPKVFEMAKSLRGARNRIHELYEQEFFRTLEHQATNMQNRYARQQQGMIRVGDIVSIKTNLIKPYNYPIGIVTSLSHNDLQEVNSVTIRKSNNETVTRHPCDVVVLLHSPERGDSVAECEEIGESADTPQGGRAERKAKTGCKRKIANWVAAGLA